MWAFCQRNNTGSFDQMKEIFDPGESEVFYRIDSRRKETELTARSQYVLQDCPLFAAVLKFPVRTQDGAVALPQPVCVYPVCVQYLIRSYCKCKYVYIYTYDMTDIHIYMYVSIRVFTYVYGCIRHLFFQHA